MSTHAALRSKIRSHKKAHTKHKRAHDAAKKKLETAQKKVHELAKKVEHEAAQMKSAEHYLHTLGPAKRAKKAPARRRKAQR